MRVVPTVKRVPAGASPLRVVRLVRGLRQSDVANAAGMSRTHLANLEAGKHSPRPSTAERLASVLHFPATELFPNNDARPADEPGAVKESAGTGRRDQL